ncbi:hypothetical protein KFU94_06525 [Chloroflexi bacterium TSY]|nr:hypothetical protein [Chloroflexi bacterium TSY]
MPAVAMTSLVALWLSLPQHFEINRVMRSIGQRTAISIGDYTSDYHSQIQQYSLLFELIPPDWSVKDPSTELVSGYCSQIYYAAFPKSTESEINYIIQSETEATPDGFSKVANHKGAALYVRDMDKWERDRFQPSRMDYQSSFYEIPRTTLFRHWGERKKNFSIDLKELAGSFLDRLGL